MDGAEILAALAIAPGEIRGTITPDAPLSRLTWFQAGGGADLLFQPADSEDLALFLRRLPAEVPVTVIGVGSNLLVRDGGVSGVVIRLSARGFGRIEAQGSPQTMFGAPPSDRFRQFLSNFTKQGQGAAA